MSIQLIKQAAHEIGITREQELSLAVTDEQITASFKTRQGNPTEVHIPLDSDFKQIHSALKTAWKNKPQKEETK